MTKMDVNFPTNDTGMLESAKNTLNFLAFWQVLFCLSLRNEVSNFVKKMYAYLWIEVLIVLFSYIRVSRTVLRTYI
jgi:hypothetical protein